MLCLTQREKQIIRNTYEELWINEHTIIEYFPMSPQIQCSCSRTITHKHVPMISVRMHTESNVERVPYIESHQTAIERHTSRTWFHQSIFLIWLLTFHTSCCVPRNTPRHSLAFVVSCWFTFNIYNIIIISIIVITIAYREHNVYAKTQTKEHKNVEKHTPVN